MLSPKRRSSRRYWETLTDDQLLQAELVSDDPESLEGLVYELPPGDEEPYVEFKYDLRGSEREKFRCVHGNHPHLAGFVMRKGTSRFLVGHICGNHIYGENFEQYTADFNEAVNRQDALRRKREIEKATRPFTLWLEQVAQSSVFELYESVRDQLEERMPWIWDNVPRAALLPGKRDEVQFPRSLFDENCDPESEFGKIAADVGITAMMLMGDEKGAQRNVNTVRHRMDGLLMRIETVFGQLKEVEDFFQPAVLAAVCKLANEHDNPKKRKYEAGPLCITCKRDNGRTTVHVPKNFRVPSRKAIVDFRAALAGLPSA